MTLEARAELRERAHAIVRDGSTTKEAADWAFAVLILLSELEDAEDRIKFLEDDRGLTQPL